MADTQTVGIRTRIGGLYFQAILKEDHNSKLRITEHPVETGANIADHAFLEPQSLSIEIGMSDAAAYLSSSFIGENCSVDAFTTLKKMQASRQPLTVITRLATYQNMLIETLTSPVDFKNFRGMRATVGLREIITAATATVVMPDRASAAPQKTGETHKGTLQPAGETEDNRSTLKKAMDMLKGAA